MDCNRLHIGPGKTKLPNPPWINLDIFSTVDADIYCSALAIPFERESFDLVLSVHVLEHLSRHTILAALTHWKSLLKPGGILRLSVPNFDAIVQWYNAGNDLEDVMGLLYGGQKTLFDCHHVVFNESSLVWNLKTVGFKTIRSWDWRKTDHSEYDDFSQAMLPHMDKENGMQMSLNLQAYKDD